MWASTCLVIAHLRLWLILLENGEQSDYIGILRDVNQINSASGVRWFGMTHAFTELISCPIETENDRTGLSRLDQVRCQKAVLNWKNGGY